MSDLDYLKLVIKKSHQSMVEGNFPAGAVVVKDGQVLSSEISSPYPHGFFHADSKAIKQEFLST